MVSYKKISEDDRDAVKRLLNCLEVFKKLRGTMPLQYVIAFLLVAEEEGLGVVDYAQRADVSVSVMSRHLLDIGDRNRHMEEGFGLITFRSNPMELRKHEYFLTDKGRQLLRQSLRHASLLASYDGAQHQPTSRRS